MAATQSLYTIITTFNPGVQIGVDRAEFESLSEQGAIQTLISVTAIRDDIYISSDNTAPVDPPDGLIWLNRAG